MPGSLETRPATLDDVPGIRAILADHGNDGPVLRHDIVGPYVRHLIEHHRARVTEGDDGLVAFGAVVDAGVAIHLADLFVRPDRMGTGIGRPLLASLFGAATRRTTFASDDPRALPLYVRAGMAPRWVCLYVEGASAVIPEAGPAVDIEPAEPGRLAALEQAWTGFDRSVDHAFWASQGDVDPFVVAIGGEAVAIAYARARQAVPARIIDRLVVRPGADPVAPTLAALRRAGRGGVVDAFLQGPSPVLRPLLDLGFMITDRDQYMGSEPGLLDPSILANPGML
jgi:GNAT superfamily N-acetyltransferase